MKTEMEQSARKKYWADLMDQAYEFMSAIKGYPVSECGETLVSLKAAVKDDGVEVTFSEKPHVEGLPRLFYLRKGLIGDFLKIAEDMNHRGWVLHVEDAFRNRRMQRGLGLAQYTFEKTLQKVIWELGGQKPSSELVFLRATALIATCPKIGTHMSGSAIDISVYRRDGGQEIFRGAPYIEMSELTPMDSPFVDEQGKRNRKEITAIFEKHGFVAYPFEFWHYSKGDAYDAYLGNSPANARYGAVDFDETAGRVAPIDSPTTPLITLDEINERIALAFK